jgi:hypothetical protein
MRICTKCKIEKPLSEYYKRKDGPLGYRVDCKPCNKAVKKRYYEENKPNILKKQAEYHQKFSEKYKEYHKNYYKNNIDKWEDSRKRNKETLRINHNKYIQKRKKDPLYRMIHNIRTRTGIALKVKKWRKDNKFTQYIGCSLDELRTHLENQFTSGMSWKNYGSWHVDHIIPLSKAKNEVELMNLSHYKNLQPLWKADNLKKGNK